MISVCEEPLKGYHSVSLTLYELIFSSVSQHRVIVNNNLQKRHII